VLIGGNQALPRQQTLRALIDWSYELLDERERRLFSRIGVFADGFTLEAATAICAEAASDEIDVLDVVASLIDKSLALATITDDITRYRLLETTRMYALEMLAASGERAEIETRHLEFFQAAAAAAEQVLERDGSDASFVALVPDLENVRAALRFAGAARNGSSCGELAVAATRLFGRFGLGLEGVRWLETALAIVAPSDVRLQSRIWIKIAYLLGNSGTGGARAFEAAERGLALARAAGDRELVAWALTRVAVAAMDVGRPADARAALAQAGEAFGPNPELYVRARLLAVRVYIARLAGDYAAARAFGEELRELSRRTGNTSGELMASQNNAEDLHALGETARAIALVREASDRAAAERDRETQGFLQVNLAGYLAAVGDAPAARAAGAEAIELLAAADPAGIAVVTVIGHLALAHALGGDIERAARLLGYWNASSTALGVPRGFTERTTLERLSAILDKHLSADKLRTLLAAGAALSPLDAIAEARQCARGARVAE
jgi:hypothetical protein